ncbi:unnamed protein product [Candidula unifasciata]|uniref:Meteorin-like protein n=1 Tax=Candidula unifasciata TaxID=100452 RepID=A0A8S3YHT0_9EUPU|nr:unnamed protein product [Candidula unifasciata]
MRPRPSATADWAKTLLLLVMAIIVVHISGQHVCDHCNCQISSLGERQAIYSLSLVCYTGTITWFDASGAVRIELMPLLLGSFRACFLVHSDNTQVKVSHETPHVSPAQNYRLKSHGTRTLQLNHVLTATSKGNEFCVHSGSNGPLLLYVEAVRGPDLQGVPKIVLHYDLEKLDTHMEVDPMEECRPCTREELLDSYCSMDFVVVGIMAHVANSEVREHSNITVHVKQLIHQRQSHFFQRIQRSDSHLTGHVTVPRKCGMRKSEGDLILTGRYRLESLTLRCASYLHDWRKIQHEVECSHN